MKVCRVAMLLVFVATVSALADKPIKEEKAIKIQDQLNKTPPPELPAKAAKAVASEKGSGQEEMAGTIISAVAVNRASSLPPVVASIAAAAPKAAARAAAEAAKASPKQAAAFAVIASKAAPDYSSQIKEAVVAQVPAAVREIESRLPISGQVAAMKNGKKDSDNKSSPKRDDDGKDDRSGKKPDRDKDKDDRPRPKPDHDDDKDDHDRPRPKPDDDDDKPRHYGRPY